MGILESILGGIILLFGLWWLYTRNWSWVHRMKRANTVSDIIIQDKVVAQAWPEIAINKKKIPNHSYRWTNIDKVVEREFNRWKIFYTEKDNIKTRYVLKDKSVLMYWDIQF